jgi:hypothetical protein
MYSKVYHLNFKSLDAAKIAASHLSEEVGGAIGDANITSLNIMLHKDGKITLVLRFDQLDELNAFTVKGRIIMAKMKEIFATMQHEEAAAIAVFVFEREAMSIA